MSGYYVSGTVESLYLIFTARLIYKRENLVTLVTCSVQSDSYIFVSFSISKSSIVYTFLFKNNKICLYHYLIILDYTFYLLSP